MPVARYSACVIAWHIWEQPVVAVCGVVPVAAIVLVFPAGTDRYYRGTTTVLMAYHGSCEVVICFLVAVKREAPCITVELCPRLPCAVVKPFDYRLVS